MQPDAGAADLGAADRGADAAGEQLQLRSAPPMDTLYQDRLQVESERFLAVYLHNEPIDHTLVSPGRFTIVSPDDPHYAASAAARPETVSARSRAVRVPLRKSMLIKATAIFLRLPRAMQAGKSYGVRAPAISKKIDTLSTVVFDDLGQVNDNIRVNQLGYLPGHAKVAYLGQYMGSIGGMTFSAGVFHLLDPTGRRVFSGAVKRRKVREDLVGQVVYELDFTSYETAGTYRLQVPGVGLSHAFDIGKKALNPSFANLMGGSYHQRCGQALEKTFTRHHREACHLDDAHQEAAVEKLKFVANKKPLYPTIYDAKLHPATRGHHDAGDYGKYTYNGALFVSAVLTALDAFGARLLHDNSSLPISGNGVPDLLEECKWELDWLETMQDPADGAAFGMIKPNNGGYEGHMPPPKSHRLFFPKDTVFTAAFAAAMARAARSPLIKKHYPAEAPRYLAKAKKAWAFLEKHQTYVHYHHYGATFEDWDERCWAALELYAATGEAKYHQYFLKHFDPAKKQWGWLGLSGTVGNSVDSYLLFSGTRDAAMAGKCETALRQACDSMVKDRDAFPYRLSLPAESIKHKTYGWYFPGAKWAYRLLLGYAILGLKTYRQAALDNISYSMGANPSGYFLHTGLGAKRNIEVVDNESTHDGIIQPVPGLPLGIGTPGFYWLNLYGKSVGQGTYPASWPLVNRWYDGFNVRTEFVIPTLIKEAIAVGYFATFGAAQNRPPSVKITASALRGSAPLTVKLRAEASDSDGRVRQYFWDFDDESFSILPEPTHRFDDAGRIYDVSVTVVDDDGGRAHQGVRVYPSPASYSPPLTTDSHTIALYHFDGDLTDSSGNGRGLTVMDAAAVHRSRYRFSRASPLWMKKPAGACLVLDGKDRFQVTFPFGSKKTSTFSVEMMIYLESFAGYAYPANDMVLLLKNRWDSWFGWKQGKWDKNKAPAFGSAAGTIATSATFAGKFPRNRWCKVKMVHQAGQSQFFVDGKLFAAGKGPAFRDANEKLSFYLGPFRGRVDEVRISDVAR